MERRLLDLGFFHTDSSVLPLSWKLLSGDCVEKWLIHERPVFTLTHTHTHSHTHMHMHMQPHPCKSIRQLEGIFDSGKMESGFIGYDIHNAGRF